MPKADIPISSRLRPASTTLLIAIGLLSVACSHRADDCRYTLTCEPVDAGGGTGGTSNTQSGGTGGVTSGTTQTSACTPPCTGSQHCSVDQKICVDCRDSKDCKGDTPVCNDSNLCVECGDAGDCKSSDKPECNTSSQCVQCLINDDCQDIASPLCSSGTCSPCASHADCARFSPMKFCTADSDAGATEGQCVECLGDDDCPSVSKAYCKSNKCTSCEDSKQCNHFKGPPGTPGTTVCKTEQFGDAGTPSGECVECTVEDESPCGVNSCDPATNHCTKTRVASVNYCGACLADSECNGGTAPDGGTHVARCIPMTFQGSWRGNYCFQVGNSIGTCPRPFGYLKSSVASVSSPNLDSYCSIDESLTTCEALLDISKSCAQGPCGCKDGNCAGGVCPNSGTMNQTCTVRCNFTSECPTSLTCPSMTGAYCEPGT